MALLKQSITINGLTLANRLVMPPMATYKTADGNVSEELLKYYEEKSRGGYIGLIIMEHSYVSIEGKARSGQVSFADDACVEGLKKLTDRIHKNGSRIFAQINHAGIKAKRDVTGCVPIGPSEQEDASAMSLEDIHRVTMCFAAAAKRAKEAGFDGVEIHSAHGYLLNQFYSPLTNHRVDDYGGDVAGRIRIHLEIIKAVRQAVGEAYPVALRLGASDYTEGGSTVEDAVYAAKEFVAAGIDLLDVSGGLNGYFRKDMKKAGWFKDASSAIKERVAVPVILTGGITKSAEAEQLLVEKAADMIGVGRAILRDSLWAKHAMEE